MDTRSRRVGDGTRKPPLRADCLSEPRPTSRLCNTAWRNGPAYTRYLGSPDSLPHLALLGTRKLLVIIEHKSYEKVTNALQTGKKTRGKCATPGLQSHWASWSGFASAGPVLKPRSAHCSSDLRVETGLGSICGLASALAGMLTFPSRLSSPSATRIIAPVTMWRWEANGHTKDHESSACVWH